MTVFYDEKGAVGRRYRRQDEVGTPFCITVDSQTLKTARSPSATATRLQQWRVHKDECAADLRQRLMA
jgi:glycyl-tRNA synthetase